MSIFLRLQLLPAFELERKVTYFTVIYSIFKKLTKELPQVFFDNQKGVYNLKKKRKLSNYSFLWQFVISTFKTEIQTCLRFDVYACLD